MFQNAMLIPGTMSQGLILISQTLAPSRLITRTKMANGGSADFRLLTLDHTTRTNKTSSRSEFRRSSRMNESHGLGAKSSDGFRLALMRPRLTSLGRPL